MNNKTRAGLSSNARWSFRAPFVKVTKTENSLYLINEDRWDIYLYDFFSLFLGVQSALEVGPTSYETLCIWLIFNENNKSNEIKAT